MLRKLCPWLRDPLSLLALTQGGPKSQSKLFTEERNLCWEPTPEFPVVEPVIRSMYWLIYVSRDGAVGIVSRYRLDGPGIQSRSGRDFPHPSPPALGPTQPPVQWAPGLFPGGKAAGAWHWFPPPSSGGFKKRVYVYIYIYIHMPLLSGSLSPRHGASSGCGWRNGLQYGG